MVISRDAFREMLARVVFALLSHVELRNRTVISHHARPNFTGRALCLRVNVEKVHRCVDKRDE